MNNLIFGIISLIFGMIFLVFNIKSSVKNTKKKLRASKVAVIIRGYSISVILIILGMIYIIKNV